MHQNDYYSLMEVHDTYNTLFNKHYSDLKDIANDLKEKLKEEFFKIYPKNVTFPGYLSRHGEHEWLHCSDYVIVEIEYGELTAQYWSDGKHDPDEKLKSITITPEMLTVEGRKDYIIEWIDKELIRSAKMLEEQKLKQALALAQMEAELARLKSTTDSPNI